MVFTVRLPMDVWFNSATSHNSGNDRDNEVLRKRVAKYRDELKQRLEKEKAKPPGK